MQRFVRVRPAPGAPRVSHPGQGVLAVGTQDSPRFIGYRRLDLQERKQAAAERGVLPRQLPDDVLYVPTGEAEVHPLKLVKKAVDRGELIVEATVAASNVAFAIQALDAAEPRKPARAPKKEAD